MLKAPNQNSTDTWVGREPTIPESDIVETLDTEVLICGAGTGGMVAAIVAGKQGNETKLYTSDITGNYYEYNSIAIGENDDKIKEILRKNYGNPRHAAPGNGL